MCAWKENDIGGGEIERLIRENNIKSVAIYGYDSFGRVLYKELKRKEIEIKFIIDKRAEIIYAEAPIYSPSEFPTEIDCIIVTAVNSFRDIEADLKKRCDSRIVSLETLIENM